ncbi:MAG: hypothetical protein WCO19_01545 [Candidatus Saccharibacteria bacterium]
MSTSKSFNTFVFRNYHFDHTSKTLSLTYGYDDQLTFTESFVFDFPFVDFDDAVLDTALQNLFFMAGVSYYKAYPTAEIRIDHGQLSKEGAAFFSNVYQKGLGEYFYLNNIDPHTEIPFTANTAKSSATHDADGDGIIIGIGGGKDSLVSVELIRGQPRVATWSLGHRSQLEPLIKKIGLPHFWVDRHLDPLLLELNNQDALNGHIPISAIFACVGTVVAILSGYQDAIVSNESSANEPTLEYQGVSINHQYSKSLEFEKAYQKLLQQQFGDSNRYYSLLRQFSEVAIAEMFAKTGFDKYKTVFSSCNRAFIQSSDHMSWCGTCSKCAFTYLALCSFVDSSALVKLWGKNLLLDRSLHSTYCELLGIDGSKPLDCVGEIKESRQAMRLAQKLYRSLDVFQFNLPENYSYKSLAEHSIPQDMHDKIFVK